MRKLCPDTQWIGEDEVGDDEWVVATTRDELTVLAGAINEALEAVEEWEFDTRLGVTPARARALRDRPSEVLRAAMRSGDG